LHFVNVVVVVVFVVGVIVFVILLATTAKKGVHTSYYGVFVLRKQVVDPSSFPESTVEDRGLIYSIGREVYGRDHGSVEYLS